MKLTNTSMYETGVVLRLVRFAFDFIGPEDLEPSNDPLAEEVKVQVTNFTRGAYRGRAYQFGKRVLLRIGRPERFPYKFKYPGIESAPEMLTNDWQEGLVSLAAHELQHIFQFRRNLRCSEVECERRALACLESFRTARLDIDGETKAIHERKAALVAQKNQRSEFKKSPAYKLTIALEDEKRWLRKEKLAKTKLRKLRSKIRRYQKLISQIEKEAA